MSDIKRKVIAILLTIFQIVSLISPAGVAVAAAGDEGFNANTFQYGVKIDATEPALERLAQDNYYLIVRMKEGNTEYFSCKPFSSIQGHSGEYAIYNHFTDSNGRTDIQARNAEYDLTIASFDQTPTYSEMQAAFSAGTPNPEGV